MPRMLGASGKGEYLSVGMVLPQNHSMFRQLTASWGASLGIAWLCLATTSCETPLERRLSGHWFGESISQVEIDQLAAAMGWVRGASFEFSGKTLTVTIPGELPRRGRYQVVRSDERGLALQVHRANGQVDTAHFSFDGDRHLLWHIGAGRTVRLRRAQ